MGRTRFLIVILLLLGGLLPAHAQAEAVRVMLQSPALADNALGLPNQRELTIYLPPGYARSDHRRYPVLYLLHGFTSAPIEWFDGSYQGLDLATVLDAQAAAGKAEYIVVIPEADNPMGGSFYVNSRAFGRWDDFISHDVVAFIDSHYRTRADRLHRGIAGQSMGGFGALSLAGRHPDLFAHVYALSPYGLDMSGELSEDNPVWRAMNKPASEWPANVPPGLVKIVKVCAGDGSVACAASTVSIAGESCAIPATGRYRDRIRHARCHRQCPPRLGGFHRCPARRRHPGRGSHLQWRACRSCTRQFRAAPIAVFRRSVREADSTRTSGSGRSSRHSYTPPSRTRSPSTRTVTARKHSPRQGPATHRPSGSSNVAPWTAHISSPLFVRRNLPGA